MFDQLHPVALLLSLQLFVLLQSLLSALILFFATRLFHISRHALMKNILNILRIYLSSAIRLSNHHLFHLYSYYTVCTANQITGLYLKYNAGLNWLMSRPSFLLTFGHMLSVFFLIIKPTECTYQQTWNCFPVSLKL